MAFEKRGILTLKWPIEKGFITNYDDYEEILHNSFYNELRMAPEENNVIILEPIDAPKEMREKVIQILFETFCVPSLVMTPTAIMHLMNYGLQSGIVLESGYQKTKAVPIFNLNPIPSAILSMNVGGNEVTERLGELLEQKNIQNHILSSIKEQYAFVSQNFERDMQIDGKYFEKN